MSEHRYFPPETGAKNQAMVQCPMCSGVSNASVTYCKACRTDIHVRKPASLQKTMAWLLTAIILYIPANLYPVMKTDGLNGSTEKTIMGGILLFIEHGDFVLAIVIFAASVVVPLAKIVSLSWLCLCAVTPRWSQPLRNMRLYRITEFLGRWSMIDVFVVALLSGLVQIKGFMSITPGSAIISFSGVVIATMFAAMSFDTRLIWDRWEHQFHE